MLSREQILRESAATGFLPEPLEKAAYLLELLELDAFNDFPGFYDFNAFKDLNDLNGFNDFNDSISPSFHHSNNPLFLSRFCLLSPSARHLVVATCHAAALSLPNGRSRKLQHNRLSHDLRY